MERIEKIQKIVDFIKSGEKDEKDFRLGFEIEHFVVNKDTLESQSFYGEDGIGEILEDLTSLGYKKIGESGMAFSDGNVDISIEPAGQFELALRAKSSVGELFEVYKSHMARLIPIFEKRGLLLVALGYHPKSKIDDIKIIPKARYDFMYKYFEKYGGEFAHNMMKGTSSMQLAVDYKNEEDFKKKYFLASALSPFLYSVFDNSLIFEGEIYIDRNLRQTIWEYTDRDRTGLYDFAFDSDLSYKKYAEKILDTPMIFMPTPDGEAYVGRKTLDELMTEENADQMVNHALSIVFPDVRVKQYIEIRMPDNIPYPYNMAAAALIKGIFFDAQTLEKVCGLFQGMTYDEAQKLKNNASRMGIFALYENVEIYQHVLDIIDVIRPVLDENENKYLDELEAMLDFGIVPRDIFAKIYKDSPKRAVYEFSVNRFVEANNG
ncbi:glutamate-cysteine ligase family protein [uncultured Anaerococcus sp.]|uniref:glutamate-cysteine ligase family protein n=1 Tax=uncultured Anaerococcus sp. TaxID=293428 RepID=UPI00288C2850|nr:glutamate-cysteine ligase family protein [uncultured Anaerococcus sp.]